MGWSPVVRSMMDRRRCAKPTCWLSCFQVAWPSGPRWACSSFIRSRRRPRSAMGRRERSIAPAMPHTVWLAYRIGHGTGIEIADHWRQGAFQLGRVGAADTGEDREGLQALVADAHKQSRPVELDLAPHGPVVPLDDLQLTISESLS